MMTEKRGVTLIELLVAMGVMSIVIGAIVGIFMTNSKASNMQKALNEASEASRTALSLITWDLQNAGYRVTTSTTNPALIVNSTLNSGIKDIVTIRYFDEGLGRAQRIRYSIVEADRSIHRAQYDDDPNIVAIDGPTVASIVAMNVRFETRANQYVVPVGTPPGCASGQTPVRDNTGKVVNCSVDWVFKDVPERLVKRIRLQLLARSELKVSGSFQETTTYTFDGGATYTTQPGYAYHFVEQTIVSANLGR